MRESSLGADLFYRKCHGIQNATLSVAFSLSFEFARCDVANLWDTVGIDRVKSSKVTQVGRGKTTPILTGQLRGKLFDYLLALFGTLISALNLLNDFTPDEPIGDDHIVVDRSDNVGASLFKNRNHTMKQIIAFRPHTDKSISVHCLLQDDSHLAGLLALV